jgi:formylglycine-generating enzyme required for sulfatase activity
LPHYEWYLANGQNRAWPIGSQEPNNFGLFDMLGNAMEWCFDPYLAYPQQTNKVFEDAPPTQPVEPGDRHVLRGGAFNVQPIYVRSANRNDNLPGDHYHSFGFRPVRTLP